MHSTNFGPGIACREAELEYNAHPAWVESPTAATRTNGRQTERHERIQARSSGFTWGSTPSTRIDFTARFGLDPYQINISLGLLDYNLKHSAAAHVRRQDWALEEANRIERDSAKWLDEHPHTYEDLHPEPGQSTEFLDAYEARKAQREKEKKALEGRITQADDLASSSTAIDGNSGDETRTLLSLPHPPTEERRSSYMPLSMRSRALLPITRRVGSAYCNADSNIKEVTESQ